MSLKTWYVPHGRGADRDVIKIVAVTAKDAEEQAYYQVGAINGPAQPARPIIDKRIIKVIKSMRKQKAKWSDIAWHLNISVPTVKKYAKETK